jgi:hypothetical protein
MAHTQTNVDNRKTRLALNNIISILKNLVSNNTSKIDSVRINNKAKVNANPNSKHKRIKLIRASISSNWAKAKRV